MRVVGFAASRPCVAAAALTMLLLVCGDRADASAMYRPAKVRSSSGASTNPKSQPGFCAEPADCKVAGYECVALQTSRAGAEEVKQCLPRVQDADVCSGQFPGLCPSFSSWTEPYKLISSVCTYKPADKCAKDPSAKSVKGEVVCVPGAQDADGEALEVIYGCVDLDLDAKELGFSKKEDAAKLAKKLGTADAVIDACLNPKAKAGTALLCGGHGTCVPASAASLEYQCRCNVGYSGDYCDKKDSNKCALPGQCSAGECNLEKQVCECPAGTTGNQCADCDASSADACSGNGQCAQKQCSCNDGFYGDHCDQEEKKASTSKTESSTAGADVAAGSANGIAPSGSGSGSASVAVHSLAAAGAVLASMLVAMQ